MAQAQVAVVIFPYGTGTVTGEGMYDIGSTFTLTATPNTGYMFVGWDWGPMGQQTRSGSKGQNSLQDTLTEDTVCTATFVVTPVITALADSSGGGIVVPLNIPLYSWGRTVDLLATPNAGCSFVAWKKAGVIVSTSASYRIYIGSVNEEYVAFFNIPHIESPPRFPGVYPTIKEVKFKVSDFLIRARLKISNLAVEINEKSMFGGNVDELIKDVTVLRWYILAVSSDYCNWTDFELEHRIDYITDYYDLTVKPLYGVDWLDKFKPITPLIITGIDAPGSQYTRVWRVDYSTATDLSIGNFEQFVKTAALNQTYTISKLIEGKQVRLIIKGGSLSANPFPSFCRLVQGDLSLYNPLTDNVFDLYVDRIAPGSERVYISFVSGVGIPKKLKSLIYAAFIS
jgi:hypothetical protein